MNDVAEVQIEIKRARNRAGYLNDEESLRALDKYIGELERVQAGNAASRRSQSLLLVG